MIAATKLKRKNPKGYATAGVSPVRRSVEPAARARAVKKNTQAVPAVIRPMAKCLIAEAASVPFS